MMRLTTLLFLSIMALAGQAQNLIDLSVIGTYKTGVFDDGAMEIAAYDATTQKVFAVNGSTGTIEVLDISDPTNITKTATIDVSPYGDHANSVAFQNGVLAAAVEHDDFDKNGKAVFFNAAGAFLASVEVGVLPDMITFTPDGNKVLTANEGEPDDDYTVDPYGTVSIIDISGGIQSVTQSNVTTLDFISFNTNYDPAIRNFGPTATPELARNLEPEYIAVSPASDKAYVVCQENNAMAIIDLSTNTITSLKSLGFKDWSTGDNKMDASNKPATVNIRNWPVFGMYQPDAMKAFENNGSVYLITANEGDARDYNAYSEEERIEDITLDPTAFPNAAALQHEDSLGRLNITTSLGDIDNDGDYDELYAYGARSFSIWDDQANLVWDSKGLFAQTLLSTNPNEFNANNDDNDSFKSRSDDKGCEPEAVEVAMINGQRFAFIGLERMGGVMVYNITDPTTPTFVSYYINRDFSVDADDANAGDLGPENLVFIPANESPNGQNLLLNANEVSGTLSIYQVGGTIGLNEFSQKGLLQAYPNPVMDEVTFTREVSNAKLYDMGGREMMIINGTTANLKNLPTGIYTLVEGELSLQILKK
ncbi:choice-of-anchor I family protein [Owenweeksia hongkongensis]|uniref:choice-of-anchor I family protein n=1 Tax=Owenweeksia hongkongensis TaxID=253245 RepID=UPI003A911919